MNRRLPLLVGIGFAIVAVLVVVLLVLPKLGQIGERQDDLEAAENEEIALQVQLRALQDAQAQAPETERQIAEIEGQVPTTADLPTLFRLLQNAADRSAVDFFSFAPGTPSPDTAGGGFSVIPSQITVNGSYFALDEFLFLLETLPRAAKVTSLVISPGGGGEQTPTAPESTLSMQLAVDFYTMDTSAGPGSVPGSTDGAAAAPAAPPTGATGATGAAEGATGAAGATNQAAHALGEPAGETGEAI
ncbi:MAG TPA: type 4a pilus biogenesis protein PilO [Actinomycetota bacterium]|nr:type 4a pilus biogenesis protein PilO [Actinomycetota bacterium]